MECEGENNYMKKRIDGAKIKVYLIGFSERFPLLSILTGASLLISLLYVFTSDLPELFNFAEELFVLVNTLGLAIIANCIFCFFQIYIPEIKEKEKIKTAIDASLTKILKLISEPYEHIYKIKNECQAPFESIPEIAKLLQGFNANTPLGITYITPSGLREDAHASWIIYCYRKEISEEIARLISMLGKYLDADLLMLLLQIDRCRWFSYITQLHNSGVWEHLEILCTEEGLFPELEELQEQYRCLQMNLLPVSKTHVH